MEAFAHTVVISDAAAYAGQLFDSLYVYARALNSTLKQNATAVRNGTAIIENVEMTFDGLRPLRDCTGLVDLRDSWQYFATAIK
ncbi:hypothetical protein KIN20_008719 [Parelaphostrongylus tenuis]|uniref:Uncharacterized protein n=1 Tax=Parelaphostrongylus tenuis TaxID=148309 RepID=A0AAD5QHQ8_PARTN|nr:hypothetical protein KIN20_008719 [Parelaphostrongylus tenuis]